MKKFGEIWTKPKIKITFDIIEKVVKYFIKEASVIVKAASKVVKTVKAVSKTGGAKVVEAKK